ncbi:NADH-quinone oxidoreductase subunit NuoG, partial [Ralstonia solanacearum]
MVEIEIDGKKVEVAEGSLVMEAARQAGTYIPHFCYHRKLSIAANCRMCLVEVEKAPKALPACATPVTAGMKVFTNSDKAVKAQKSVMEFLLINHPLDCPICDQGGECQLQDLAVGYGKSESRYQEEKRVVFHKNVGPLISMEEMTRCIHCTRCVRFGQEVAGVMELGMLNRGEHSEITTFVGQTVDSELSGNMIDLCPVGALTSKPFRYQARTWELARRKSVSPHDGLGANVIVQTKNQRVMRVLPLENEAINECWLSDKDRFAYEGLNSDERLTQPMLKQGGQWQTVDWTTALEYVANGLNEIKRDHGVEQIGALASPHSTLEELFLLQKLVRGIGSDNVDFRLRQSDFSAKPTGAPWLGMPIAEVSLLQRTLVVGAFLRKDHPLLAARLRQGGKKGAQLSVIGAGGEDLLMPATQLLGAPSQWLSLLSEVAVAIAAAGNVARPGGTDGVEAGETAKRIAASLASGERKAVFLGNAAVAHPQFSKLHALAQWVAQQTGATLGFLTEAANTVGGYLAGALPQGNGLDAAAMLAQPRRAYVIVGAEPEFDAANPQQARAALEQADTVVVLSPFASRAAMEYADVLLPVAPFTETSGTFVNCEGLPQSFSGVVRSLGDSRPAWKVLRVLGNLLGLSGFDYDTSETVRDEVLAKPVAGRLSNATAAQTAAPAAA